MRRKELVILLSVDGLILTAILAAYLTGALVGASRSLVAVALWLPVVFNLAYFAERSKIRLLFPQEPLSIISPQNSRNEVAKSFPTSGYSDTTSSPTSGLTGRFTKITITGGVIALILVFALVEIFVGDAPVYSIVQIATLGISLTLTAFVLSVSGNFWRPNWAEADPGLNLGRCLIVAVLCTTGLTVISMGIQAWFGTLEGNGMGREVLREIIGLSVIRYYGLKIVNKYNAP